MNASTQQKSKQIEEIIAEANKVFSKVQAESYELTDADKADALLTRLREEHKDFALTLPLVLRVMVQMKRYKPKALERYLKKMAVDMKNWKSRQDFIESQADYMIILYKTENPRYNTRRVQEMRADIVKQLLTEEQDFTKMVEEAEKEADELQQKIDRERREFVYKRALERKARADGGAAVSDDVAEEKSESTRVDELAEEQKKREAERKRRVAALLKRKVESGDA